MSYDAYDFSPKLAVAWKDKFKMKGKYCIQDKLDGVRVCVSIIDGEVEIFSRNMKPKSLLLDDLRLKFEKISLLHEDIIFDGELLDFTPDGKMKPMSEVMHIFGRKNEITVDIDTSGLVFNVFDAFYPDDPDLDILQRLNKVQYDVRSINSPMVEMVPWYTVVDPVPADLLPEDTIYEGIMLMKTGVPYPVGKRNQSTVKFKNPRSEVTGLITDAKLGTGRNKDKYSSFEVSIFIDGKLTPITNAGSGLTDSDVEFLNDEFRWRNEEIIVDVLYDSFSKESLRFPILSLRHDLEFPDAVTHTTLEELKKT